jgi:hypothetical protein
VAPISTSPELASFTYPLTVYLWAKTEVVKENKNNSISNLSFIEIDSAKKVIDLENDENVF